MRKAGDILFSLFNEKFDPVFLKKARTTAGLFSSWEAIIQEVSGGRKTQDKGRDNDKDRDRGFAASSAHSRIAELEHGILLIETDHPGWRQILQTKQSQLLHTVQRHYPELEIRGIAFRLSRDPQTFSVAAEVPETPAAETFGPGSSGPPASGDSAATGEPALSSLQGGSASDPVADEAYNVLKKQLEESIKKRNKNWARSPRVSRERR
jgi:hypothetical protein